MQHTILYLLCIYHIYIIIMKNPKYNIFKRSYLPPRETPFFYLFSLKKALNLFNRTLMSDN